MKRGARDRASGGTVEFPESTAGRRKTTLKDDRPPYNVPWGDRRVGVERTFATQPSPFRDDRIGVDVEFPSRTQPTAIASQPTLENAK
ncbi:hypothetical protein [Oxynema aestuarii]|uniref:Uncharacterized protein n=1 Tax=Oxynema aestuarii AP17 TaxID=2064643 RepID=A0A6H1TSV6_9CYAN|nr:hypothetical protein [Oxynema aestuarii]QIZ69227.1 hypothetical protein HCG48_00340 [Oxynema aestuarii AP17]RMH77312.1 MAG: hypothetical protein D6680_05310 [Cyanobacteria bacterium J007]